MAHGKCFSRDLLASKKVPGQLWVPAVGEENGKWCWGEEVPNRLPSFSVWAGTSCQEEAHPPLPLDQGQERLSPARPLSQVQRHQRGEDLAGPEGTEAPEGHQQGQGAEGELGGPGREPQPGGPREATGRRETGPTVRLPGRSRDPPASTSAPLPIPGPRYTEPQQRPRSQSQLLSRAAAKGDTHAALSPR